MAMRRIFFKLQRFATIDNYNSNTLLAGTSEADSITNYGYKVTITTAGGDDTVSNVRDSTTYGSSSAYTVSIDTGAGNDSVSNYGGNATINTGAGNDSVYDRGDMYSIINTGEDDDYVFRDLSSYTTINTGSGNDTVCTKGWDTTINTDEGNDSVYNDSFRSKINTGEGNDSVFNDPFGNYATINTGEGDDLISLTSNSRDNVIVYKSGDGNDIINGFNDENILSISGSTYSTAQSGDNVIITVGTGKISLIGAASLKAININDLNTTSNTLVSGTSAADFITSYGQKVTITTGEGDDTVRNVDNYSYGSNSADSVSIDTGAGNDSVYNSGDYATIDTGAGNDTVRNGGNYGIILTGAGNDSIFNNERWATIDTGAGNDSIYNSNNGDSVSINTGAGDDTITNSGANLLVTYASGDGNDSISGFNETSTLQIGGGSGTYSTQVSGSDIIVTVGDGNITLVGAASLSAVNISGAESSSGSGGSSGNPLLITLTEGNDSYYNEVNGATILALGGDDTIYNFSYNGDSQSNASIDGGAGADYLRLYEGSNNTVTGGLGNDTIDNAGSSFAYLNGGAGNDEITNNYVTSNSVPIYPDYSTLDGGAGDDTISNYGDNSTILGGADNDYIYNSVYASIKGSQVSIDGGTGNDSIENYGNNVSITGGTGDDYIQNGTSYSSGGNFVTVNAGDGADTIENYKSNVSLSGGEGDDYIFNEINSANISLDAGSGSDTIYNYSNNSTVNAGAGNDYIQNGNSYGSGGMYNTINAGDGNDTIENNATNVSINGGAGNDSIYSHTNSNNITINGGTGADYIDLNGIHLIEYTSGDGNDTISGFNNSDTLQIGGGSGTYSSQVSGSDIIVSVGSGSIILQGAAYLDSVNIWGSEVATPAWTMINSTTAAYGTNSNTYFTVSGVKSTSGLSLSGNTVTVSSNSLNNSNVTISNYSTVSYNLALGDNVTRPSTTAAGWSLSGTTATYKAASTTAGYSVSNNQIVYNSASGGNTLFTVSGVKSTSGLSLSGNTVTVSSNSLNNSNVSISNSNYNLAIGTDVATPSTTAATWSYSNNVATYKAASTTAGYSVSNNQIVYNSASGGNTLFTVSGVKSTSGLSLSGNTVTVSSNSLNSTNVSISNSNYKLALGSGVTTSSTTAADWSLSGTTATYKAASTTAGYSVSNNQIVYTSASGGNTLFTVSGVKSTSGLSLSGNTVTVSSNSLNSTNVSISNSNYKLALGSGVTTSSTTAAGWSLSGTTATYKAASTTAGYSVSNNQIVYNSASGGNTLFTVSGVKSTSGLSLNGTTVTVAASALNGSNVSISNSNYKLALANDVAIPSGDAAGWTSSSNGIATYKAASNTAGYNLVNNQIVYTPASSGETFTISGISPYSRVTDYISVNGKTVTISKAALIAGNVTITGDGYNLALGSDVTDTTDSFPNWNISGTTATYQNSFTKMTYTLSNDGKSIVYSNTSWAEKLITVTGVKSREGLSLSGTTVTVSNSALNNSNVTISDGYNLALDSDVTKSSTTPESWSINGNIATYKASSTSAGYSVVNGQIVYTAASGGESFTVSGVKSTDGLSLKGSTVTVAASALNGSNVTVSSGYKLALASGIASPSTTAAAWSINNNVATYKASSTSAGYSVVNNQIVYIAASGGESFTVSGVKSTDGLSLSGSTVTVAASALNGSNVSISGGYKLALASGIASPSTTAAGWTLNGNIATYKASSTSAGYNVVNNQIVYTPASGGESFTVSGVKSTDGLSLNGSTVTVAASALNGSNVSISNGYKLALASGIASPSTTAESWSINGNVATYKASSTSAGYSVVNGQIVYTPASGGESFTVSGVKSTDGLSLKGSTVTVAASALNGSNVTISNGYKLALASGIASPSTTAESWTINGTTATYKAASTTAGYSVVNGQIVYTAASGGESFTVSGVKSTDGLSLKGSTVTVAASALNGSNVTVSSGYKLALASGIASPSTTAAAWNINNNVATYKASSTSAGYSVVNGQIVYTAASGGESFTVSGVKSTDGLSLNGSTVTVAASALNGSNVTVSSGYKLALASGIASPSTTAAAWSINNNVATYKASSTSAGYSVVNNQIVYTPASGGESFTVSGVKSTDGLSLNGSTVTVAASALNQSNVSISNSNYKLALANGIASPSTTAESWTINGTTATFKSASNTAGYNLVNGQIVYSAKKTATTLATVTGLKSGLKVTDGNISGITVSGNTITLAASVLGKTTVEVSGDYKLALAANVNNPTTKEGAWTLNGTTATYKGSSSTAGYTITGDGKSVLYSAATTAATLSTIKGIKTTSGISINENFVNLKAAMLNAKVTVSGEYGYNFAAGNYSKKVITGSKVADNIISNGKNLSINTGAGADSIKVTGNATSVTGGTGNDTIVNSGDNNIFIYTAGDGKDIIYGFDNTSKLKIGNGKGIYSSKTEGNDVIVTVGDGKITLVDAVKLDTVNILGKADVPAKNIDSAKNNVTINGTDYDDTIKSSGQYVKILSGAGHDSINVSGSNVTVNGATGDDTIVSSGKYVSINAGAGDNYVELTDKSTRQTVTSNAGDDYILNAGKNVSISTGAGNDTILTSGASVSIRGGNGSDVFTFNGGGGIINDYAAEDIIRFTKGAAKVTTSGQNVIFTVGSNKVTVKGGKGKLITYYDTKGEHTYPTSVELSGSTATLLKNYSKDSFNVADYGTYNTINASAVTHDLSITANKNANRIIGSEENDYIEGLAGKDTILGGDGNDTILGGAGNDSLSGGKGSDVFVYSKGSGNDIITDYTNEDMIQIVDAKPAIKTSGNDVVFTVGSGKITVKNSAKKIIAYTDSTGNPQTYFNTLVVNGTTATLTEMYTEKTYTAGAKIVMVDAADVNHNLKIKGNAKANDILGGSGNDSINGGAGKDTIHSGAGKDTILGGTGDDLLFGGEGADLFVYGNGGGKDVIGDYREEDKIKITSGTISKATAEGNDVVYKIGSGSITVLDGVGKNISFVNSNGKAIKPPTITINANVPYWFIQDDDAFTTAQLDSIVETSEAYSFDEMQPSDSLTQENILVSYSSNSNS